MNPLKRGDKIFLDPDQKEESGVNQYLACRDGVVEAYEYRDESGYGSKTRLFFCRNTKHETAAFIRQTYSQISNRWIEESLSFDSDSFEFLVALITGKKTDLGIYSVVRNYAEE